jgi:hypothetical protein
LSGEGVEDLLLPGMKNTLRGRDGGWLVKRGSKISLLGME